MRWIIKIVTLLSFVFMIACGGQTATIPLTLDFPSAFVAQNDIQFITVEVSALDFSPPVKETLLPPFDDPPVLNIDVLPGTQRNIQVAAYLSDNPGEQLYSTMGFFGETTVDIPEEGADVALDLHFVNFAFDLENDDALLSPTAADPDISDVRARAIGADLVITVYLTGLDIPAGQAIELYVEGDVDRDPNTPPAKQSKIAELLQTASSPLLADISFTQGTEHYFKIRCETQCDVESWRWNEASNTYVQIPPLSTEKLQAGIEFQSGFARVVLTMSKSFFEREVDADVVGTFNVLAGRDDTVNLYWNDIAFQGGGIYYDFAFEP